uniref:Uncharacterized protein n=1 Tax=Romanomermis culicivorax TaxID=13658 RepID=A0A915L2C6_ROMCU
MIETKNRVENRKRGSRKKLSRRQEARIKRKIFSAPGNESMKLALAAIIGPERMRILLNSIFLFAAANFNDVRIESRMSMIAYS